MQLSQKQKTFSEFFARFSKSAINFKYFEKKHDLHRLSMSEITDSENVVRYMSKKPRLRTPFHKHHGKHAPGLWKSASQQLYRIK